MNTRWRRVEGVGRGARELGALLPSSGGSGLVLRSLVCRHGLV